MFGNLRPRLIELGVLALGIDDLDIDAGLTWDVNKVVHNIHRGHHILQDAPILPAAKTERDTVAAERVDCAGNGDTLAARFTDTFFGTVEMVQIYLMIETHTAVDRRI